MSDVNSVLKFDLIVNNSIFSIAVAAVSVKEPLVQFFVILNSDRSERSLSRFLLLAVKYFNYSTK